jgi:hypothetical protein
MTERPAAERTPKGMRIEKDFFMRGMFGVM